MSAGNKLITDYSFNLVEDHHHPGSSHYGVRVILPVDISAVFPYLNAVLDNSRYDHENGILVGVYERQRYAFRPHEIQAGAVSDRSEASLVAGAAVELVNRIWQNHENIVPCLREQKLPAVYDIYKLLPRTNCRACGYTTCLACAADIRRGVIPLDKCPLLSDPEYVQKRELMYNLFSSNSD